MKAKNDIANSIFDAQAELDQARAVINALYIVAEGKSDIYYDGEEMHRALNVVKRILDGADDALKKAAQMME